MKNPLHIVPHKQHATRLTADDLHLFNEGSHLHLYEKLGAHLMNHNGKAGTYFAVWAPDATTVSVVGDFNEWNAKTTPLHPRENSGIWEGFVPNIGQGAIYKYHISSRFGVNIPEKTDPMGFYQEHRPRTASVVWDLDYQWCDDNWMATRSHNNALNAPISIYELHMGSWKRVAEDNDRPLTYREIAPQLVEYMKHMGFTHVEFLPLMEHPFDGSWGYQTTGYFAATSRYGTPQDMMHMIDVLHQNGIGVILDWVPSHFPVDGHALASFDGSYLYEHADPRKGFHPDWGSAIFNYNRNEVRSFLMSSASYWMDKFHIDGLRVDAVASMLYLDYSRRDGGWIPNMYGGRENLEAISFLQRLNHEMYRLYPDTQMFAEESTSYAMVSRPTYVGGLGFGFKWDMGWMNDTLRYFHKEPIHRKYHLNDLTFRQIYAHTENFVLPLSHDEVVHGKGSLIGTMPGDFWQKFANLRLLLGYQHAQQGKKLLFMGCEFGQWDEWNYTKSLDWHLLNYEPHQGLLRWVADLNHLYRNEPALYEGDCDPYGFEWIDCHDSDASVLSFVRRGRSKDDLFLVVCNCTPVPRYNYEVGIWRDGYFKEVLNSDATTYGGSGMGNLGGVNANHVGRHNHPYSLNITLPPLSILYFKKDA